MAQKILLDTNILFRDLWMKGRNMASLVQYIEGTRAILLLPRIIREELVKNYGEKLKAIKDKVNELGREIKNLHSNIPVPPVPDKAQLRQDESAYRKWLDNDVMKRTYVEDHDYRVLSLENITAEAIAGTKPGSHSVHLKDLLIWHAAKASASQFDEVCLLTGNWRDFAKGKDQQEALHQQLEAQLQETGKRVRLFSSIPSFLSEEGPQIEGIDLDWFAEQSACGNVIRHINDAIFEHEQHVIASSRPDKSGILHVSVGGLVTKPKYLIAQQGDGVEVTITVWFESSYEFRYEELKDITDMPSIPFGRGMQSRSLLTTAWFDKNDAQVSLKEMGMPFDW